MLAASFVPCLFLCAIFKRPIFQWIACAALFVWVCFVISKLFRSHRKHCKKMPAEQKAFPAKQEAKPLTETPQEADDDTRLSLLRQVNYRIMDQLKQSYPTVSWLWDTRPSSEDINRGCTKRIKLYHCDPFNFGEVTLSASGKLEIALIQLVPLAEAEVQPKSDEDLEEKDILSRNDVKQWYYWLFKELECRVTTLRKLLVMISALPGFMCRQTEEQVFAMVVNSTSSWFSDDVLGEQPKDAAGNCSYYQESNPYWVDYQLAMDRFTDCLQASWQRSLLRYGRHPIGTAAQEDLCDLYAGPVH